MKTKLRIKKKILKYANKKVKLQDVIIVVFTLFVLIQAILGIRSLLNKYVYEDTNGNIKETKNCIVREDGTYCEEYVKVNWYYKK